MDTADFLRHLQSLLWYEDQLVHLEQVPSRTPRFADLDPPLDPRLLTKLDSIGVSGLYSHQVAAIQALRDGKNVIVATPAASGKSMCYNLPALEALIQDRAARALYLYPTKALAQDQHNKLAALIPDRGGPSHAIYDGDTPGPDRSSIRRSSRIVISNPDMLHLGILPNHRAWYRTLRGLKYVVLDEAHVYRGVFGTHVANVIRRLRRICRMVGSSPQFILCSATISNPAEHAGRLVGLPFEVVGRRRLTLRRQGLRLLEPARDRPGRRRTTLYQLRGRTGLRRASEAPHPHHDVRPQPATGRAALRVLP